MVYYSESDAELLCTTDLNTLTSSQVKRLLYLDTVRYLVRLSNNQRRREFMKLLEKRRGLEEANQIRQEAMAIIANAGRAS